jgi:outer membrane protein assembly factor BamB
VLVALDASGALDPTFGIAGVARVTPFLRSGLAYAVRLAGGQIMALDPATGNASWTWRGPGPGYASPVVFDIAGTTQIVTLTDTSIIGLDAKAGGQLESTGAATHDPQRAESARKSITTRPSARCLAAW